MRRAMKRAAATKLNHSSVTCWHVSASRARAYAGARRRAAVRPTRTAAQTCADALPCEAMQNSIAMTNDDYASTR